MKVNAKVLIVPPYISTSWENVESLSMKNATTLFVALKNGLSLDIPHLSPDSIKEIFECHEKFLETPTTSQSPIPTRNSIGFSFPLEALNLDSLPSLLQHNPEQAKAPLIPPEILSKMTSFSKTLGIEDLDQLPKPEPDCNCLHCQIAKALGSSLEANLLPPEEEVSEKDLSFRSWDISQTGEKLYLLTNPLDTNEQYHVFLGEPLGCTCGQKNCEHIKAVLNS